MTAYQLNQTDGMNRRPNECAVEMNELTELVAALKTGDGARLAPVSHSSIRALTSHRGSLNGVSCVAGLFGPFVDRQKLDLMLTNIYFANDGMSGRASAYMIGDISGSTILTFGAALIADMCRNQGDSHWLINQVKMQLTWIEGDADLRSQWTFPILERHWRTGDPQPVIVSELDAPWWLYPKSTRGSDDATQVADVYARYSWGVDQADIGLLSSCFAPEAAGTLRPLGYLTDRHAIVGVIKEFRKAWPVMQHYAKVLGTTTDGDTAAMIVGRIIPQHHREPDVYGAYYPIRLRRQNDEWTIVWIEYRPGWFSSKDIDLGRLLFETLSGEGDRTV